MPMTHNSFTDDLNLLMERIDGFATPDAPLKISGLYVWCYNRKEFEQACKLLGPMAVPNYQNTSMTLCDQLPGGLNINVSVDYRTIQSPSKDFNPSQPIKEPPAITKYAIDPEMVELIEGKIGAGIPKI